MEWTRLTVEVKDGYAIVALKGADKLNTLSIQLRKELALAVAALEADEAVVTLILTGAGTHFSAGMDVREWDKDGLLAAGAYEHDAVAALRQFSGPVIGAINGLALTGGLELALACDFLIAAASARFADSHTQVGLLPGWGGSVRLARRVGIARAMEIAVTGRFVGADEALAWGLVNHVVPDGELMAKAEELARQIAFGVPAATRQYKQLLLDGQDKDFQAALAHERAGSIAGNRQVDAAELTARLERLRKSRR